MTKWARFSRLSVALAAMIPASGALAQASGGRQDSVPRALPDTTVVSWTRITYLSGPSVYLEVGSKDGVREGSRLQVVRAGDVVAELVAVYLSSNRTACTVSRSSATIVVGDSVRFAPVRVSGQASDESVASNTAGHGRLPTSPIRGRFGIRYLLLDSGEGTGNTLTQPAFDLRLDGQRVGGTPFGLAVDVRAQRSMYSAALEGRRSTAPASLTRVYQAAVQWSPPGSPTRLSVGRQFATALTAIGIFDGVALDVDHARVGYGALAGFEPDLATFGFSSATREYGAWVQLHNQPSVSQLWSLTLGGVGSYADGQIDREFLYLRAAYTTPRVSIYAAQELDVNRGWRGTQEGAATTPTSTFAMAQLSVTSALSVYAGVDNRRNVRLYRDYRTPELAFDDAFRQGLWGGTSVSFLGRIRLAADVRSSTGGAAGEAKSYTGSASVWRITPLQLGVHARATRFAGLVSEGQLQSASIEINPMSRFRIEYTVGARNSTNPRDNLGSSRLTWTGLDADIGIGRSVYLLISTSRESGTLNHSIQSYASLSYRF